VQLIRLLVIVGIPIVAALVAALVWRAARSTEGD
jgi:hypothetical protein